MSSNIYDQVEYFSHPVSRSHPDHLHCIGRIFGVEAAPVETAHVLELTCGDGGNIIPLAALYPNARFFGMDYSERAIERGKQKIQQLGLSNIELAVRDLHSFEPQQSRFDYIIAHGAYSWINDHLKQRLLRCIRTGLAPNGIAFVSYNTLPGWHQRLLSREFMTFHTAGITDPKLKAAQGRAALQFLAETVQPRNAVYHGIVAEEHRTISQLSDWHLLHDHLEENSDPRYFLTFIEEISAEGLQYLADAELSQMLPLEFPKEVQERLGKIARDPIRLEQYLDFLRNRMFRRSLIVRDDIQVRREFRVEDLMSLSIASPLRRTPQGTFVGSNGGGISGGSPHLLRALTLLEGLYPAPLPFSELANALGIQNPAELHAFAASLLQFAISDLLHLRSTSHSIAREVSELPCAFSVARLEARTAPVVSTLEHETAHLSDIQRIILAMCDGKTTVSELSKRLAATAGASADIVRQQVPQQLEELRRMALLMSV